MNILITFQIDICQYYCLNKQSILRLAKPSDTIFLIHITDPQHVESQKEVIKINRMFNASGYQLMVSKVSSNSFANDKDE
jgi:hypothetical protein